MQDGEYCDDIVASMRAQDIVPTEIVMVAPTRALVVQSLVGIHAYLGLSLHTLLLGVDLLDRYLARATQDYNAHAIILTAYRLAAKYEEDKLPYEIRSLSRYSEFANGDAPQALLHSLEYHVCETLEYSLGQPTSLEYLELLLGGEVPAECQFLLHVMLACVFWSRFTAYHKACAVGFFMDLPLFGFNNGPSRVTMDEDANRCFRDLVRILFRLSQVNPDKVEPFPLLKFYAYLTTLFAADVSATCAKQAALWRRVLLECDPQY